ncbi:hypothetical protein GYH30_043676 [Glycine max]|nr:hypothetical protein GYH30_043676 [Glycine max]
MLSTIYSFMRVLSSTWVEVASINNNFVPWRKKMMKVEILVFKSYRQDLSNNIFIINLSSNSNFINNIIIHSQHNLIGHEPLYRRLVHT